LKQLQDVLVAEGIYLNENQFQKLQHLAENEIQIIINKIKKITQKGVANEARRD